MAINEKQKYLLGRIPSLYDLRKHSKDVCEPREIKVARRAIEKWELKQKRMRDEEAKRLNRMLTDARDAVYFSTPEKAIALIVKLEALRK